MHGLHNYYVTTPVNSKQVELNMDVLRNAPSDGDTNQLQLYAEISPTQEVAPPPEVTGHTPPEYEDVVPKRSSGYKVTLCAAYGVHGQ